MISQAILKVDEDIADQFLKFEQVKDDIETKDEELKQIIEKNRVRINKLEKDLFEV